MGGEVYLAEYGRAKTIHFDLVEVDGVDLRVDAADGGSDCIVMTNEAAEGTATNDFVDEGTGYSLVLTAAEMAGARITVYVVDSATKVWLDKTIQIETFGHQSSAHPNMSPYWTNGAVAGGTPTTTVFIVDGFTEATDDHLIGGLLTFTSGANLGQSRAISDYDDTTGTQTITLGEALLAAPADNDEFVIGPRPAVSGYIAGPVWDEVLTGGTHNVTNSAGRRLRQIQEAGGYSTGAIYIDTVNGTTGTTDFENGVETKPAKNIADANTLASSLSLSKFVVAPGSSITFAASQENQEFIGENWDLALGGQSVSNSHITGADVTGTGTSSVEVHFEHCEIGDVTLGLFHMDDCDIEGTVTLSATGTSFILGCYHAGTPIIDFGDTLASSTVHLHDYHGAITISELGSTATDILHFSSPDGKLTMDSTCIGGTLNLNGTFDFVNNGSNITVNQDGRVSKAAVARVVNPQVNTAFSNITFEMYDSTNHNPNTGLTVTGERSLDGGAYAGVSGTIAEISDGTYQFDAAAGDMNGALVVFRFSSSGADDTFVHVKTAA